MENLFLSVGSMKAGTTFLFQVLQQHPGIHCTPEKEIHYFAHVHGLDRSLSVPLLAAAKDTVIHRLKHRQVGSLKGEILTHEFRSHRLASVMRGKFSELQDADQLRKIVSWYAERYLKDPVDDDWFNSLFECPGGAYCADFSNYYSLLGKAAWGHIRSIATKRLRVVYFIRDPVERLWSHFKFHCEQSGNLEPVRNFTVKEVSELLQNPSISPHSKHGDIVANLQDNLAPEELMVVILESFLGAPQATLRKIERFLGIRAHEYQIDISRKMNTSISIDMEPALRSLFLQHLHPQLQHLSKLGVELPESYYR